MKYGNEEVNLLNRVSILENQMISVTESLTSIHRKLSSHDMLKRLLYYIVVGIIYVVNKELESNVNMLKSSNYWLFNVVLCLVLVLLRRPIMWFISKI